MSNVSVPSVGSSPRVRGKRLLTGFCCACSRIIPARAGQTGMTRLGRASMSDHPRACGANPPTVLCSGALPGSSPRVRGKRQLVRDRESYRRIIPARAGQTLTAWTGRRQPTDHPRACGANMPCRMIGIRHHGSSPRVRGKPFTHRQNCCGGRIIPARAGQTMVSSLLIPWFPDHPRACGANPAVRWRPTCGCGSSPRVRGKRLEFRGLEFRGRIIPARAGQTGSGARTVARCPDHPRACGANVSPDGFDASQAGSSPRVRGKP